MGQIQIDHLAKCLPSKSDGRHLTNVNAATERLELISLLEKVSNNQDIAIIKGFPVLQDEDVEWLIQEVMGCSIYQPTRRNVPAVETFSVQPFLNLDWGTLSESSRVGGFHTDFWSASVPPKYILLQCIKQDPKHPYFGRNQYVKIDAILNAFNTIFKNVSSSIIETQNIEYKIGSLLFPFYDGEIARFHEYIAVNKLKYNDFDFDFISIIREISLSQCIDFVLNETEIVIINNHKGLHRRGEATYSFNGDHSLSGSSRCLRTARFY
jgi:hypothetical protein